MDTELIELMMGQKGDRGVDIVDATLDNDGTFHVTFSNGHTKECGLTAFKDAYDIKETVEGYKDQTEVNKTAAATSEANASHIVIS